MIGICKVYLLIWSWNIISSLSNQYRDFSWRIGVVIIHAIQIIWKTFECSTNHSKEPVPLSLFCSQLLRRLHPLPVSSHLRKYQGKLFQLKYMVHCPSCRLQITAILSLSQWVNGKHRHHQWPDIIGRLASKLILAWSYLSAIPCAHICIIRSPFN